MPEEFPKTRAEARKTGSMFYFTGKPCVRGHVAKRYTKIKMCVLCASERNKKSYEDDKDNRKIAFQNYYERNRDHRKIEFRAYYAENREVLISKSLKRVSDNPDLARVSHQNYRSRSKNAEGRHTSADLAKIRKLQNDRCACCLSKLHGSGHLDHIKSLARGGSNYPSNLQFLCGPCNISKHARDSIEFMQSRGWLL